MNEKESQKELKKLKTFEILINILEKKREGK